ncbi:sodium ion-translocating decarboxylase subunit beta [Desulfosporosinus sp.]|uniref:sodium ion-translocating decarboxylase subunit beta n=1 Tax=Desulfosporosinus sp. TaxID=157907 RepID=UPI0023235829|nr:sodium ion-translocating decarboxylase subunit beta [Desulfosporosinus sp.]MCO5384501.1 sodium ion-translocating decarboxylase subunit beta [Desulfosporosinus sp.]MDA8223090.1 sodium ion-translocating decarboxylase subunit beta [Desulfitobacterium hafniense]
MFNFNFYQIFQGIGTLFETDMKTTIARIVLIFLGIFLVYLGTKGTLEPLIMIPMGFGMSTVNAAVLYLSATQIGTIIIDPNVSEITQLINILQIDFLQPIYTFMFSNGLIACFVFMGIGVLSDISFLVAKPFSSMFIAICAELGTVATFPIAVAMGLNFGQAASVAMVGGADGPMVLYTSLILAKDLFVPITIVAYLYLSLTYGGYPYLIKLLVPKRLRAIEMDLSVFPEVKPGQKIAFSIVVCTVLSLLFPMAAPLFLSFFLGVAIRESGIKQYVAFLENTLLYSSTLFLGLILGVLTEANTIMNPTVLKILILGILSLLLSGIGGIIGGYIMYFITKGKYNPTIGIAGVSCVPTTAKVAQKSVSQANPQAFILPYAMGANISGVITSAILAGVYVSLIPYLK